VAIAASYFTVVTNITSSAPLYTTATTGYKRDLVVTNSGASTLFVAAGPAVSSAATTSSFAVPTGGSLILTQCQVPVSTILYGVSSGTASASLGWASLVTYE